MGFASSVHRFGLHCETHESDRGPPPGTGAAHDDERAPPEEVKSLAYLVEPHSNDHRSRCHRHNAQIWFALTESRVSFPGSVRGHALGARASAGYARQRIRGISTARGGEFV